MAIYSQTGKMKVGDVWYDKATGQPIKEETQWSAPSGYELIPSMDLVSRYSDLLYQPNSPNIYGKVTSNQQEISQINNQNIASPPVQNYTSGYTQTSNDPRQVLAGQLSEMNKSFTDYMTTLKSQPSAADLFKQYSEELGISSKDKELSGIRTQVQKTEDLLNNLEKNITSRMSTLGGGMTEAERARTYATEKKTINRGIQQITNRTTKRRGRNDYGTKSTGTINGICSI